MNKGISMVVSVFPKELFSGDELIAFNIMTYLCLSPSCKLYSDGKTFVLAQNNPGNPVWLFCKRPLKADKEVFLFGLLNGSDHNFSSLNGNSEFVSDMASKLEFKKFKDLIPYACHKVQHFEADGEIIDATLDMMDPLLELVASFTFDTMEISVDKDKVKPSLSDEISKKKNKVLKKDGIIASMAKISSISENMARIDQVFTKPEFRNQGFAKALMSNICENLLPVLYADKSNPPANAVYQAVGFDQIKPIVSQYKRVSND